MTGNMRNKTFFGTGVKMRVALLALPGNMRSALAGLADMFWLANQVIRLNPTVSPELSRADPFFDVRTITADGQPVRDVQGRIIESDGSFNEPDNFELIIASGMQLDEQRFPADKAAVSNAAEWLKVKYSEGSCIASACAGGFVLGEAGLLNGRVCTTTWWLYPTFAERYPLAKPIWGKTLAEQDNVITAGGPLSWVDLVIYLVRNHAGNELAKLTADMAVADSQPLSQQIYAPAGFLNSRHPLLTKAESLLRYQNPAMTVKQLAAALNMTTRTLNRKMKTLIQESPKDFITRVRIETASVLLESPGKTISQIANICGYSDETAFRRAFSAMMGMSPGSFRKRLLTTNPSNSGCE
ncbi:TPA: helix-turn-helix domain-containing protein [Enterobacter cloacae]|jgi:transcriptional regulator GlxA family with amidase domain|uniref:AraC family transcriptional regulator n=2 Tax=Enterobacter cloacae TaxID=550 RepID=A0AAE2JNE4_ENTCL|nr:MULTISPECIES: helix-turn-helix domain-containing protein [Enterobacter]EGQ5294081.1 helix-turn-helix domain-containing protein [Enterobacter cloacae]EJD6656080.1 helix-turn-helix domain-containing protein [Enterobacter cloacae]EKD5157397.1 helix-turn-helix domain-containing protein [Enterobacter cloacae]EKM5717230.1 helix-turn-helix domain-containing protein [Enterobacter cloacae]EKP1124248.1 helix-turn-helix domain-containing protein [Enterobacter cloacae]